MWSLRVFQFLFVILILSNVIESTPVDTKAPTETKPLINNGPSTTKDPKCLLPMETGPCRMKLSRFYYNAETDACEEFTFGGCRGNENSFGFKQTCEEACKKPSLVRKQLNPSTLKSLTVTAPVTQKAEVTTVTTPKPQNAIKH